MEESQNQPYNANPLWLTEHNGVLYSYNFGQEPRIRLENIKSIQSKTGDIFLCSILHQKLTKSKECIMGFEIIPIGTHCIMEMVNMLTAGSTEHPTKFNFLDPMIVCNQVLDSVPCLWVFQSHLRSNQLQDSFLKRNGKIIYILRNPKNLLISLYSFMQKAERIMYAGTWGEFFKVFFNGKVAYFSWSDHVLSWEREMAKVKHRIHSVSYEDLQEDAVRELDHINNFLSLNQYNSFLQSVAEYITFTKMKNQTYFYHPFPAVVLIENYAEFLIRKGIVGNWRRWYSDEQSKQTNDAYTAEMSGSKVIFCYE